MKKRDGKIKNGKPEKRLRERKGSNQKTAVIK